MSARKMPNLPRRQQTIRRYLRIVKFASGRNQDLSTVARHFGCSEATVLNASKALGLTYEEVRRRRSLRRVAEMERHISQEDILSDRDRRIVDCFNSKDAPTLEQVGTRFKLSRQRVHQVLVRARKRGVRVAERSSPAAGHWVERCNLCRRLLRIAKENPLITSRRLAESVRRPVWTVYWHLKKLRARNLVPKHFGCFRSERLILALQLYNRNRSLTATAVGRQLGYKNLPSVFRELRDRGFGYLILPRRSRTDHLLRRSSTVDLLPSVVRKSKSPVKHQVLRTASR